MRRLVAASLLLSLTFAYSGSATDLTSLFRPTIRGGAANSQVYFVMTDRFFNGDQSNDLGGLTGFSGVTGFDPRDPGYFHGGDLKGLTEKLDYIKNLGFNSIWITPPVKQKTVQGNSAAYHGYWGLDFTTIDPHLGTEADFRNFVETAHEKGLKVIVDIVVNHTADVIKYQSQDYSYVETFSNPYKDCSGKKFDLDKFTGKSSFPKLCLNKSFPKVPYVSNTDINIKSPAFLNDLSNYHNRGNTTFNGESNTFGDFYGLDDLFTEKPVVLNGWIKVWQDWITKFDIDGYRIDTAKHVNPEFWKAFIPAVLQSAKAKGKDSFPIFGEVADSDPNYLAEFVTEDKFPGVLDFALQAALSKYLQRGYGVEKLLEVLNQDDLYTTATSSAYGLTTFLGNHDMGRIGSILQSVPGISGTQLLERDLLANAALLLMRGGPAIYYGDEKGFIGNGGDKDARQDMFATQVVAWQKEERVGSAPIGNESSFSITNPIEKMLSELQHVIVENPALRSGTQQSRYARSGIFAFSRYQNKQEYLVVLNANDELSSANIPVSTSNSNWKLISGKIDSQRVNIGTIEVSIPARSWAVLKATSTFVPAFPLKITLSKPVVDSRASGGLIALTAAIPGLDFNEVTFVARAKGQTWQVVGTSDHRTLRAADFKDGLYRVYLHPNNFKKGSKLEVVAIAKNSNGDKLASAIQSYTVG